jgi:hypothetical protein
MNVANLFLRAGRAHADLPEVARGPDVLLSYGELVRRGAVLAAHLRAAPESRATRDRPYMRPMVGQPLMSVACRARISFTRSDRLSL